MWSINPVSKTGFHCLDRWWVDYCKNILRYHVFDDNVCICIYVFGCLVAHAFRIYYANTHAASIYDYYTKSFHKYHHFQHHCHPTVFTLLAHQKPLINIYHFNTYCIPWSIHTCVHTKILSWLRPCNMLYSLTCLLIWESFKLKV